MANHAHIRCHFGRIECLERGYDKVVCQTSVAVYLRSGEMLSYLAHILGEEASQEDVTDLFDRLVLRGQLRPWRRDLWELDSCFSKRKP